MGALHHGGMEVRAQLPSPVGELVSSLAHSGSLGAGRVGRLVGVELRCQLPPHLRRIAVLPSLRGAEWHLFRYKGRLGGRWRWRWWWSDRRSGWSAPHSLHKRSLNVCGGQLVLPGGNLGISHFQNGVQDRTQTISGGLRS